MIKLFLSVFLFVSSSAFAHPTYKLLMKHAIKIGEIARSSGKCVYDEVPYQQRTLEFTPSTEDGWGYIRSDKVVLKLANTRNSKTYEADVNYQVALVAGNDLALVHQSIVANKEIIHSGNLLYMSSNFITRAGSHSYTKIATHTNGCDVLVYAWIIPQAH